MTETVPDSNKTQADLSEITKRQLDAALAVQSELLDQVQSMSQAWFVRAQSELDLFSETATKFASARSFPEAAAVGQEWMSKRWALVIEDSRRSAANGQKLAQTSARLFTPKPSNGGT
jgi:hypothetical protein